jgi:hypothetical protein
MRAIVSPNGAPPPDAALAVFASGFAIDSLGLLVATRRQRSVPAEGSALAFDLWLAMPVENFD